MSEEVLPYHRKHRPKKVSEYIGNEKMKKGAMSAFKHANKPQVLLFQGPSGGGKTTFARLVAKEYLCENRDPEHGACNECYSCKLMEEYIETGDLGMNVNVREIDVTGSSGKQDIEELLADIEVSSYDGSWKIFILDECHVMSNSAQNRLLKTLEEPPEKVLIMLCTTDPEKLLGTILSRCQYTFKVTKPTRDEMCGLLARICKAEGVKYEAKALSLVAVKGNFAPRKTLIELERVVKEAGEVTYNSTLDILEMVGEDLFFRFYDILTEEDINIYRYIAFLGSTKQKMELNQFVESLIDFTVRGLYIYNGTMVEAMDRSELAKYKKIFQHFSPQDVANLLDELVSMKSSMDVEVKLMLLGYKGYKRPKYVENPRVEQVDTEKASVGLEKQQGESNRQKSLIMTEEEKVKIIQDQSKVVGISDIASMFNAVKVDLNKVNLNPSIDNN